MKRKPHTVSFKELYGEYDTILASSSIAGGGKKRLIARMRINATGAEHGFLVYKNGKLLLASSYLPQAMNAYNEIDV